MADEKSLLEEILDGKNRNGKKEMLASQI